MKIAFSSSGKTLNSLIDPRFGRCQYFIIVNSDTMDFEVLDNAAGTGAGGAGIETAQKIAPKGVEAIITGNCGPNAFAVLSAAGIKVITGVIGKISDAIEDYKSGKLQASSQANVGGHFGMGHSGIGRGMGHSQGR
ncbi:MAG: NifB/NifX family molybdenum-iron cluster-binding protein [Dehalococcoidales bacterium]|nr:NifB/NifX family molybdenum-iron cluster-binding protein [Dehalococcoidales bacterium]